MTEDLFTEEDFHKLNQDEQELLNQFFMDSNEHQKLMEKYQKQTLSEEEANTFLKYIARTSTDVYDKRASGLKILNRLISEKSVFDFISVLFPQHKAFIKEEFESYFDVFKRDYNRLRRANMTHKKAKEILLNDHSYSQFSIDNLPFIQIGGLSVHDLDSNIEKYSLIAKQSKPKINEVSFGLSLSAFQDYNLIGFEQHLNLLRSEILKKQSELFIKFIEENYLSIFQVHFREALKERLSSFENDEIEYGDEFTLNRQILVLNFMLEKLGIKNIDNTVKAKFYQFITRRNLASQKIENTELYKKVVHENFTQGDYEFVKEQLKPLGLDY